MLDHIVECSGLCWDNGEQLLLKLNVGFIIIVISGGFVNARFSEFVIDDDLIIFITVILQLLYEEEVCVAPDVACGGCRQCDILGEGARSQGNTMSAG